MEKLSAETLESTLEALPGWVFKDEKLHRVLNFADFVEAFAL